MFLIIGALVVIASVIGGYTFHGGYLMVLWQPAEFIIIIGASIGAFIIGNRRFVLRETKNALKMALKGNIYNKQSYIDLLTLNFKIFKLIRTKGMLELEAHIENPHESSIFQEHTSVLKQTGALTFLCDYLRLISMGTENVYQMEDLMNEEVETKRHERMHTVTALHNMADGLPALGIVAAVLGVINTMGAISQPPEILGRLIGAALVGTFVGVLLSYGFVGPTANIVKSLYEEEIQYYQCIKSGILAMLNGYAPAISVEFARKSIEPETRPDFYELEEAISDA